MYQCGNWKFVYLLLLILILWLIFVFQPFYNKTKDIRIREKNDTENSLTDNDNPNYDGNDELSNATKKYKCAYPMLKNPQNLTNSGEICVMVRTFHGHFELKDYNIYRLAHCLEQMEYTNWNAYIFQTDPVDIEEQASQLIQSRNPKYRSKFHYLKIPYSIPYKDKEFGYNMTDFAIRSCPDTAEWLLVTNGDNEYGPKTFSYLQGEADGCAFDFFTRHILPKSAYHKQFPAAKEDLFPNNEDHCASTAKHCMRNQLQEAQTDLGATIWNLKRWREIGITYSKYTPAVSHDAYIAEYLRDVGWKIKSVSYCYFSHGPNDWANCRHRINKTE